VDDNTATEISGGGVTFTSDNTDSSAGSDSSTAVPTEIAPPLPPPRRLGVIQGGGGGGGGGSRSWGSVVSIQDWKDRREAARGGEPEVVSGVEHTPLVSVFYNTTVQPTLIYSQGEVGKLGPFLFGAAIGYFLAGKWWGAIVGGVSALVLVSWTEGHQEEHRFETVDVSKIEESTTIPRIVQRRRDRKKGKGHGFWKR
jgi:hypothetical protein